MLSIGGLSCRSLTRVHFALRKKPFSSVLSALWLTLALLFAQVNAVPSQTAVSGTPTISAGDICHSDGSSDSQSPSGSQDCSACCWWSCHQAVSLLPDSSPDLAPQGWSHAVPFPPATNGRTQRILQASFARGPPRPESALI